LKMKTVVEMWSLYFTMIIISFTIIIISFTMNPIFTMKILRPS
jgi:hypothetical protein